MRLPTASLVVLVGPAGSGKSHWAAEQFRPDQVVSSDALRSLVGTAEHDQRAGSDAFAVLDLVLERRASRGLLTVIDTLGLDPHRRAAYLGLARRHGMACHAVMFDTPAEVCRARNKARSVPVPPKVLSNQLVARETATLAMPGEGFDAIHPPEAVEIIGNEMVDAPGAAERQVASPVALRFGLQLSSFRWDGGGAGLAARLAEVVSVAEAVGFSSIWLMDHLIQIPQVGRPWEDLPESWTTLAWIAAHTHRMRIGALVTCGTFRHPAHLAKIVATLDVLSGGRAVCGIGLGWWKEEHRSLGIPFPTVAERYAVLEDTLQVLPLLWGPGSPAFAGRHVSVPAAICYPRPLQDRIPILVGGSGEARTLRLAARHADACNLFGDPQTVRHKVEVLRAHCRAEGRDPSLVRVTHLSTAVTARTRRELDATVDRLSGAPAAVAPTIERFGAGTVEDQVGRFRALAEAGVETAIVSLPDVATPGALECFGEVIAAFASRTAASW